MQWPVSSSSFLTFSITGLIGVSLKMEGFITLTSFDYLSTPHSNSSLSPSNESYPIQQLSINNPQKAYNNTALIKPLSPACFARSMSIERDWPKIRPKTYPVCFHLLNDPTNSLKFQSVSVVINLCLEKIPFFRSSFTSSWLNDRRREVRYWRSAATCALILYLLHNKNNFHLPRSSFWIQTRFKLAN